MKLPILALVAVLAADARPQSAPLTTAVPSVPHSREDAPRRLKIIDLRELLKSDTDVVEMDVFVTRSGVGRMVPKEKVEAPTHSAPAKTSPEDPQFIASRAAAMQELIDHWIRPALLAPHDTLQITRDGTLIANLTDEAHAWLDHFLVLQRESRPMIDVQLNFLSGPRAVFDRFLKDGSSLLVTANAAEQILADAKRGDEAVKLVTAPHLLAWVRTWSYTSTIDPLAYVKDWSIAVVEPGHQSIAVPAISSVEDGVSLGVRGVLLDETHVGLELDGTQSTVKRPIATKKVKLDIDGGREVELALPEVSKVSVKGQVSLEFGGYALLGGLSSGDNTVAVLIHVARAEPSSTDSSDGVTITAGKRPPEKH